MKSCTDSPRINACPATLGAIQSLDALAELMQMMICNWDRGTARLNAMPLHIPCRIISSKKCLIFGVWALPACVLDREFRSQTRGTWLEQAPSILGSMAGNPSRK